LFTLLHLFLIFSSYLLVPVPQTGPVLFSCSPLLKRSHFCLFKVAIQGVSSWHLYTHTYIYIYIYIYGKGLFITSKLVVNIPITVLHVV
jgi:hypothetical protein